MPIREFVNNETGETTLEKFPKHFVAETEKEATELYEEYKPVIKMLANKASMITGLDVDDLESEGTIGLARAARDFENNRGAAFKTFAIFKIKDAIREFSNDQTTEVNIPQYVKDAKTLASSLKILMSYHDDDILNVVSLMDIWDMSEVYDKEEDAKSKNKELINGIKKIREKLKNLAQRSCTSVHQLLERADLVPAQAIAIEPVSIDWLIDKAGSPEDILLFEEEAVNDLFTKDKIDKLKKYLSEEEFTLLYEYYGEDKTLRELAKKYEIKAPSVFVRIQEALFKVRRAKGRLFGYENINGT